MITFVLRNWLPVTLGALLIASMGVGCAERSGRLAEKAAHAKTKADHALAVAQASEAARAEEARRYLRQKENADETARQLVQAEADLAGARTAGERLQRALAAVRDRSAAGRAAVATVVPGEPGGDPVGVLADVLARADAREERISLYADRLRIAGASCERAYDALTPRP